MQDIKQLFQTVSVTLGIICAIAFCFGYIPAIPSTLFLWSMFGLFVFDLIESAQESLEKRKEKAAKRNLISL